MASRHLIALVACSFLVVSCSGGKEEKPPASEAPASEAPAAEKPAGKKKKGKGAEVVADAAPQGGAASSPAAERPVTSRAPLGSVLMASSCSAQCLADKFLAAAPEATLPDAPHFWVGLLLTFEGPKPGIAEGVTFVASRPSTEGIVASVGALLPETPKEVEQLMALATNVEAFVAGNVPGIVVPTEVYHHLESTPRRATTPAVQGEKGLMLGEPPIAFRRTGDLWMGAELSPDGKVLKLGVYTDRVLSMPAK